jgi:hypothetical protein
VIIRADSAPFQGEHRQLFLFPVSGEEAIPNI